MASVTQSAPGSNKMLWAGRIVSAIPVLMLLFSGFMKFAKPAAVVEGFAHLGWDESLAIGLGIPVTNLWAFDQVSIFGLRVMELGLAGRSAFFGK